MSYPHHQQDQWDVNEGPVSSEWLTGCRLPGWVMVTTGYYLLGTPGNWATGHIVQHFGLCDIFAFNNQMSTGHRLLRFVKHTRQPGTL